MSRRRARAVPTQRLALPTEAARSVTDGAAPLVPLVPDRPRGRPEALHRGGRFDPFVRALAPDPTEWRYEGTWFDAGPHSRARCTCGQAIRYVFIVRRPRDGSTIQVGSVCITTAIPLLLAGGAVQLADDLSMGVKRLRSAGATPARRARAGRRPLSLLAGRVLDAAPAPFAQLAFDDIADDASSCDPAAG